MESNIVDIAQEFSVKSDTIFSVLTTLTVFVLGLLINGIIKGVVRLRKRSFNRALVKINLPKLVEILEKQILEFEKFVEFLHIDNMSQINYTALVNPHIQIIYEIGYVELHKCYFSGIENLFVAKETNRIESFGKLWGRVNHLQMAYHKSTDEAKNYVEKIQSLKDETTVSTRKPRVHIENFLFSLNGKTIRGDFAPIIGYINQQFEAFRLIKIPTPTETNKYLLSIQQIMSEQLPIFLSHQNMIPVSEMMDDLRWADYKYGNQINITDGANHTFKHKIKVFKDYVSDLEYAENHLQ